MCRARRIARPSGCCPRPGCDACRAPPRPRAHRLTGLRVRAELTGHGREADREIEAVAGADAERPVGAEAGVRRRTGPPRTCGCAGCRTGWRKDRHPRRWKPSCRWTRRSAHSDCRRARAARRSARGRWCRGRSANWPRSDISRCRLFCMLLMVAMSLPHLASGVFWKMKKPATQPARRASAVARSISLRCWAIGMSYWRGSPPPLVPRSSCTRRASRSTQMLPWASATLAAPVTTSATAAAVDVHRTRVACQVLEARAENLAANTRIWTPLGRLSSNREAPVWGLARLGSNRGSPDFRRGRAAGWDAPRQRPDGRWRRPPPR